MRPILFLWCFRDLECSVFVVSWVVVLCSLQLTSQRWNLTESSIISNCYITLRAGNVCMEGRTTALGDEFSINSFVIINFLFPNFVESECALQRICHGSCKESKWILIYMIICLYSLFPIRISLFGDSETMAWAILNLTAGDDFESAQQDLSGR